MRTTGMRLVAAVVATSLAVTGLAPLAHAQQPLPPVEGPEVVPEENAVIAEPVANEPAPIEEPVTESAPAPEPVSNEPAT